MIKNTNADCIVRDIKIIDTTAYITLLISSSKPTPETRVFNFYIQDEGSPEMSILSNTNYWIDRYNNYDNNILNVDVNMYKQVTLKIDITNQNKGTLIGNRWVRNCYIILTDVTNSIPINAWYSNLLKLVSKEIVIPELKDVSCTTDTFYNLQVNWKYKYESQEDFNYSNLNTYSEVVIKSPYTNNILETIHIEHTNTPCTDFKVKCLNTYEDNIIVEIYLKNFKDETLTKTKLFYKPVPKLTNTYIKTATGIKKVQAFYVKKEA